MNTPERHDSFAHADLDKFNALANRGWGPEGPQRPLHVHNPPLRHISTTEKAIFR